MRQFPISQFLGESATGRCSSALVLVRSMNCERASSRPWIIIGCARIMGPAGA
jgi:hypothetical protein